MAPLAVDPEVLDGAGAAVISVGEGLGSTVSTLTTVLVGCHGMAGDDPAGAAFGGSYNHSTSKLLDAMATTRNGLCRLGDGVRTSAYNYSVAETSSNMSGRSHPLPGPHPTGAISADSTPSAVGHGVGAPAGWGWVSKYIGMIWPTGDSAKLRTAAAAWTSAGTNFEVDEILGVVGPMNSIAAQQIPEGPAIATAFTETTRCAAKVLQQCVTIATQLTSYAGKIDTVHAAIIDLLSRICNPLTGIKEVWEFLTDEDEDEIRKIANDIRVIVKQFTAEVDALRQQIATALTEAKTVLGIMTRYAEKEWDHFLHTTDIGRVLDHVGQMGKGLLTEAEGFAENFWQAQVLRAIIDPEGFWRSVSDEVEKVKSLTGLEGTEAFEDSWKELGKDTVHWDEWATNPFLAAGKSLFDVGTFLLPGGALSKLPKLGHLAADAAEKSGGVHPSAGPAPAREPAPPPGKPAPRDEAPRGGQPAAAPTPRTPMPPYGHTESKAPVDQRLATGSAPKPAVEPLPAAVHAPPSTANAKTPSSAPGPPPPVIGSRLPHGGAPSAYLPQSPAHDYHGPLAHDVAPAGPLTSSDLSAFADYTGLGHEDLNDALRNSNMDASQHARVEALSGALEKLPPHGGLVYRGADLPPEVLAQYQRGSVVTEIAFVSTSTDPAVAHSSPFAGIVEFRILSRTGRDISSFSAFPSEQEVLFPTGLQFYVVDRRTDPLTGRTVIEMVER